MYINCILINKKLQLSIVLKRLLIKNDKKKKKNDINVNDRVQIVTINRIGRQLKMFIVFFFLISIFFTIYA